MTVMPAECLSGVSCLSRLQAIEMLLSFLAEIATRHSLFNEKYLGFHIQCLGKGC